MFLLDTNVISELAPTKRAADANLVAWLQATDLPLFLSAVTILELTEGAAKAARVGAVKKAQAIDAWIKAIRHLYASRILPFDAETASLAGTLADRARAAGHAPHLADVMIAATAGRRRLTVMTRNLRHFRPFEIPAVDPFDGTALIS